MLCGSSSSRGPHETSDGLHDATHITTRIGRRSAEEAQTGLLNKIGLFNFTFCGILRRNKFLIDAVSRVESYTRDMADLRDDISSECAIIMAQNRVNSPSADPE